jgi:hypothetical protein
MSGLHLPWVPCPECDSEQVYDMAWDDAPLFQLECRDCSHTWQAAGFGMSVKQSEDVEGYSKDG